MKYGPIRIQSLPKSTRGPTARQNWCQPLELLCEISKVDLQVGLASSHSGHELFNVVEVFVGTLPDLLRIVAERPSCPSIFFVSSCFVIPISTL